MTVHLGPTALEPLLKLDAYTLAQIMSKMPIFSLRMPLWEEKGLVMRCPLHPQSSPTTTIQLGRGRGKLSSLLARLRFIQPKTLQKNLQARSGVQCSASLTLTGGHVTPASQACSCALSWTKFNSCCRAVPHHTKAFPPAPLQLAATPVPTGTAPSETIGYGGKLSSRLLVRKREQHNRT